MFGDLPVASGAALAANAPRTEAVKLEPVLITLKARIDELPEVLRPSSEPAHPVPTEKGELEEWVRITQRKYLLFLAGAIHTMLQHGPSFIDDARCVLVKLNGMGGRW
jgi:hypothetical protein